MHDKDTKPKKRNGIKTFNEIQDFIDQLFTDFREEMNQVTSDWMKPSFFRDERQLKGPNHDCLCPLVDIRENSNEYRLVVSLPGICSRDNIDLIASDDKSISITAKLEKPIAIKERNLFYQKNVTCGRYHREINFLKTIDHDNISAKFKDGILTISVGKRSQNRRINID